MNFLFTMNEGNFETDSRTRSFSRRIFRSRSAFCHLNSLKSSNSPKKQPPQEAIDSSPPFAKLLSFTIDDNSCFRSGEFSVVGFLIIDMYWLLLSDRRSPFVGGFRLL